jgi:multisubunit Na+/H+ antiporter MnhF subunit
MSINTVFDVIMVLLLISLMLVIYRLVRGPTLPDRAVASDQIAIRVVGLIAVYSMSSQQSVLIDLVIVVAVVGFLSMAIIGIYIDRAARGKAQGDSGA